MSEKLLGVFTERCCTARFLRLDPGADFEVEGKRDLFVVLAGTGTVEQIPYRLWTAVFADWNDRVRISASEPTELINLRLPDLRDIPAAGHSEQPATEAAE